MPTVFNENGFKFSFFSQEGTEAMHVHVNKGGATAKYWLDPVSKDYAFGFNPSELRLVRKIIERNKDAIIKKWADHFSS